MKAFAIVTVLAVTSRSLADAWYCITMSQADCFADHNCVWSSIGLCVNASSASDLGCHDWEHAFPGHCNDMNFTGMSGPSQCEYEPNQICILKR